MLFSGEEGTREDWKAAVTLFMASVSIVACISIELGVLFNKFNVVELYGLVSKEILPKHEYYSNFSALIELFHKYW